MNQIQWKLQATKTRPIKIMFLAVASFDGWIEMLHHAQQGLCAHHGSPCTARALCSPREAMHSKGSVLTTGGHAQQELSAHHER